MNEITQSLPEKDDCNFAMLAHLLGIFTGFIGALLIWLLKKDSSAYIAQESAEALNFQLTVMIGYVICGVLTLVLIGLLAFPLLYVVNIVFCILGAVAASKGTGYRYPFVLRLIK
ncbi:DUF4870 domain-containing protein [Actimicrobium sp. CCC2.4]|uniref:DUF4870 domain-containing protein n=1 Tax=Actimicrobium sp. CCC2.4 TaxID=3048606 RepID=UPI002AC8AA8E|nr:DUF4870 domain-containing protein [Actimicrobium sp. CCC2.4]MEB0135983.1 DUF4870 domain-containing protein [Actimicrobium sp. CCC2.4]WPX32646.1 DUF4870 domain-containing protein [Actimicrobium sp. CCC2.4]